MSVVCNRCEEAFNTKLELVMHFWLVHGISISEAEKGTDSKLYGGADSGCVQASEVLGYPSSCYLSCPFKRCVYDEFRGGLRWRKRQRNRDIRKLCRRGMAISDVAAVYSVSIRTVQRAIKGVKANA